MNRFDVTLKFVVPSDPRVLAVIRAAVGELGSIYGLRGEECRGITLAVDEALGSSGPGRGEPGERKHMPAIHFLDVTNRDGVQTARTGLSKFGKTMVNFYLGKLGVAQSEIGLPVPVPRGALRPGQRGAGRGGRVRRSCGCPAGAGPCRGTSRPAAPARPAALQPVDLDVGPDDRAQVPRPARPRGRSSRR